jgi:predicted helicase
MTNANIHYYDIGDYLNREEKLKIIKDFGSISNPAIPWQKLQPNEQGDWISMRNESFESFIKIGERGDLKTFWGQIFSNGLKTQRDAWCYSFSINKLSNNITTMLEFYNNQRNAFSNSKINSTISDLVNFLNYDNRYISWTESLINAVKTNKPIYFEQNTIIKAHYRPFTKNYLYYNRKLNERVYQMPKIFPIGNQGNLIISVQGAGDKKEFSVLISDKIVDLGFNGACQCFPLYYYEEKKEKQTMQLFSTINSNDDKYIRRDGVSDFILERAKKQYGLSNNSGLTKEDIFYYVYGFLHSPEYREIFANDLKKMLPRIPLVDDVEVFWAFSKAGRKLADLHINYEEIAPYPDVVVDISRASMSEEDLYHVEKMRFIKKEQKDTILYNSYITVSNIPEKAYEYVVNGKSAIEWIIDRYRITIHKESQIKNDPNDWAKEHNKPSYILELLLSIINVSVQTVDIVNGLPKMQF